MRFKELVNKCDAIVFPAYIADENDLHRINHLQMMNDKFNKLFPNTIICINYRNSYVRNKCKKQAEKLFNFHFNNVSYIHNKINYENVR